LPRDVRVLLGVHDLNDQFEVGKEIRSVKSIFVHPDWNPDVITFDADIASIFLEKEIIFNNYIQPICLWVGQTEPQVTSLVLVGYGKSEDETKKHENIPKVLTLPIHTQEDCFLKNQGLVAISSKRTFCAGSADGTGACLGDSGGGLYLKLLNTYFLRGIVSSSLRRGQSCDVNTYSVYTDVLKYKNWIKTLKDDKEDEECGIMSSPSGLIQTGKNYSKNFKKISSFDFLNQVHLQLARNSPGWLTLTAILKQAEL
jgi:secreted trypsin-like serine protease